MIKNSVADCIGATPVVRLSRLFEHVDLEVLAKLEFLNPGGSVKDRAARFIITEGLKSGMIHRGSRVVESTSGNFGVALAMISGLHGIPFTAVVDPKTTIANLSIMRAFGAEIDMVTEADDSGGYLLTRLRRVEQILDSDQHAVWLNQYANTLNWQAHYYGTGQEIVEASAGRLDCFVAAVSTSGTVMGVARRLRESFPEVRIVAVDTVGSVVFGGPPASRLLPGIGSSRRPELLDTTLIDRVVHVTDEESVRGCHDLLARESIMAGGSSGSVVAAINRIAPFLPVGARVMTLLPDRGERYLDIVYPPYPNSANDPAVAVQPADLTVLEMPREESHV